MLIVLASTALSSRRGGHIGDREFLLMIGVMYAFATSAVAIGIGTGQVALTALSLSTTTIMGAVFCGSHRHVANDAVFAIAALLAAEAWPADGELAVTTLSTAVFSVILMSVTLRLLKDVAVAALARAKHGLVTDPMTGLSNRRGLERFGAQRWVVRARLRLPPAFLVLDVDHFTRINDTEGHAAGDEIVRRRAALLLDMVRIDDVPARLGGEEFLVLSSVLPGHGEMAAERLRAAVEAEPAPVTVSIGVHEVVPEALVRDAGRALGSRRRRGPGALPGQAPGSQLRSGDGGRARVAPSRNVAG